MDGKNPTLYGYVGDVNGAVDVLGLKSCSSSDHEFLYRFDKRTPKQIRDSGRFKAWGTDMDLPLHADGTNISNRTSGYVSTTKHEKAAEKFSHHQSGYIYKIKNPGNGVDVNQTMGKNSPFPEEFEVSIPNNIPISDIINYWPINI